MCKMLLDEGWRVVGIDCMSDYYDLALKNQRESMLIENSMYRSIHEKVEKPGFLKEIFCEEKPTIVFHLAAQAGVRYSIEDPRTYLESNIIGTFELLEAARKFPPKHMLLASTSSVYGGNKATKYKEIDKADQQLSFYAATKKSTETMAHSYAHLFKIPITMFRFFTVYGPWGRPDMALFKFTDAILKGENIDVYNYGQMKRDFTYIDDLVEGLKLLMDVVPLPGAGNSENKFLDSKSEVAPFRIVNIGNSKAESLGNFISAIETSLELKAKKNLMPMQPGDVPATWADISLLEQLTGFKPKTKISDGITNFISWYKNYYNV